ncbi:MAG: LITAF-like zinc ribbon domain-containing protein [Gemmatimonadetes bacterium]|nr:LITAF-like zinc ribbon domain-containing protein [Gemmatimonadota bacterium]
MSRPSGYGVPAQISHGAVVPEGAGFGTPVAQLTCPNCGFQGEGVSYFSQGGPIMIALLLAALTIFPFMGVGGLIYYLMRYDHRACPRCGTSWGKRAERARALAAGLHLNEAPALSPPPRQAEMSEDARGLRIAAWILFAFAAVLMIPVLGEGALEALFFVAASAGGGALLWKKANSAREERRAALLVALQHPVLQLASQRNGVLTVTDVAAALSWPMPRAEKVLNSLEDGLRVASTVSDEGVIVYEFRELMHAPRMNAAERDTLLNPGPARERSGNGGTLMV